MPASHMRKNCSTVKRVFVTVSVDMTRSYPLLCFAATPLPTASSFPHCLSSINGQPEGRVGNTRDTFRWRARTNLSRKLWNERLFFGETFGNCGGRGFYSGAGP